MTDYVSGLSDLDTALAEIDASWPEGVEGEAQAPSEEGLGSEANPIKVLFVPSVDTNFMIESGEISSVTASSSGALWATMVAMMATKTVSFMLPPPQPLSVCL